MMLLHILRQAQSEKLTVKKILNNLNFLSSKSVSLEQHPCCNEIYFAIPTLFRINANSNAVSFIPSYRPVAPP